MEKTGFNTHNLRIKIPVEKQVAHISDSGDISESPLPPNKSCIDDSLTGENNRSLCRKIKHGAFLRLYYLFTRCFE